MRGLFRIGVAVIVGVAFVGGAYFLREQAIAEQQIPNDAAALVASKILHQYQHAGDKDGDGMFDWEESLRGTDPATPNAMGFSTSTLNSKQFEAKTLTEKFAIDFFSKYLVDRGEGDIDENELLELVSHGKAGFEDLNVNNIHTEKDIVVSQANDTDSIRRYGNEIGAALRLHSESKDAKNNEVAIVGKALSKDSQKELDKLVPIREGYVDMVRSVQKISVPSTLVNEHLALLNSLQAIKDDIAGMEQVFVDPMLTLVRMQRYEDDALGLFYSIDNLRNKLEKEHVTYEASEGGSFLFSFRK